MSQKIHSPELGSLSVPEAISYEDLKRTIYKKTPLYRAKLKLLRQYPKMKSFIKLEA